MTENSIKHESRSYGSFDNGDKSENEPLIAGKDVRKQRKVTIFICVLSILLLIIIVVSLYVATITVQVVPIIVTSRKIGVMC